MTIITIKLWVLLREKLFMVRAEGEGSVINIKKALLTQKHCSGFWGDSSEGWLHRIALGINTFIHSLLDRKQAAGISVPLKRKACLFNNSGFWRLYSTAVGGSTLL